MGELGSLALFAGGTALVMWLVWEIFCLVASIKVIQKMGEPWWKAIIPIYHSYVLYDHVWVGWIGVLAAILEIYAQSVTEGYSPETVWTSLLLLVSLIIQIIFCNKLSKAFGHGIGYTIGLLFLEPIFILILGFGSDRYLGNPSN